jgi:DNA/RNA-binding domain of Phe-tRNA-synthetase-like protein
VLGLFPEISIGVVRGSIRSKKQCADETIAQFRREALESLLKVEINGHPHITLWREAYQKFGTKPRDHRPTHEAMARRLLKDGRWPEINPIVDVYITNQVAHLLPHGGYAAAFLNGDISLTTSPGGEAFEPLGGGIEATLPGEVVYRDSDRILTRRWNYRDCDSTKIDENTEDFVLMIEAPASWAAEATEQSARDLVRRYLATFDGQFEAVFLTVNQHSRFFEF